MASLSGAELWYYFPDPSNKLNNKAIYTTLCATNQCKRGRKFDAARRGVLLGTALLLLIAYSVLLAVMAVPETADAELPMLALAYGLSRPLGYVYGILLLLCMYGSALSMTVAITTYASARSERVEKRRGWFILALGALGYAASSVGFGDLISVVYPVFGYCSSVFIVCLLVHAAQVRKKERNFFENAGTKEEEISS